MDDHIVNMDPMDRMVLKGEAKYTSKTLALKLKERKDKKIELFKATGLSEQVQLLPIHKLRVCVVQECKVSG